MISRTAKQRAKTVIVRPDEHVPGLPGRRSTSLSLYFDRHEFEDWKHMAHDAQGEREKIDAEPLAGYVDRRDPQRWPADSGRSIYATPATSSCGRLVDLLA